MVPSFYRKGQPGTSHKTLAMLGIWLAILAAALDLALPAAGGPSWNFRPFTKALPAIILGCTYVYRREPGARWLQFGLGLAAWGDVQLYEGEFLTGMLCFAAMHVCYIRTFILRGATPLAIGWWTSVLPYALGMLTIGTDIALIPHAGTLAAPVAIYSVLLTAMVYSALSLIGRLERRASFLVAAGALLFMCSDTTLAFAKFWPTFPLSGNAAYLAINGIYFAAQILIASGLLSEPTESRST